jgi:polysaccharide biosynthesis protein PslG
MARRLNQDRRDRRLRRLTLLFFMILLPISVAAQIPTEYFGMQANSGVANQPPQWWSNPWPEVTFGSMRLWDASVAWAQINTADGVYDWTLLDKWLSDAQKFNVPEVMYTFGQTPRWASSNPNDQICAVGWGPGECDPPKDLNPDGSGPDQIWKNYVAAIASHSAGRIKYWEIWNEPKNLFFWNGTVAQLVRMAKDARSVILSIDPQAVLLTPPSHGPFQTLYFAAGGPKYADIITYHGYVYRSGCIGYPRAADELKVISGVQAVMATYGQSKKPLWDTEVGWGVTSQSCFYDRDLQAGFLAQLYMLHWSAGVVRALWYQYNNQLSGTLWEPNSDPHHRNYPGTLLKPGIAYKQVYKWMVGATMNGQCSVTGTTWTCDFSRPGGYLAQAIWDTSQTCHNGTCGTIDYGVGSQYTNYLTLDGKKVDITGGTVPIGAKPILIQNR